MLDTLSCKMKLWKLQRKIDKSVRSYEKDIDNARKVGKSTDEIDGLIHELMYISGYIEDKIEEAQYQLICRQAENFLIPTPRYNKKDGSWEQSDITGRWRFSHATISQIKDAIRQEQKHRREHWFGWLSAITGIIGALIGLLSVLLND